MHQAIFDHDGMPWKCLMYHYSFVRGIHQPLMISSDEAQLFRVSVFFVISLTNCGTNGCVVMISDVMVLTV